MPTLLPRDEAVQREWQTLSRRLSHALGFCFIVYFVRDERIAIALKQRLQQHLHGQGRTLHDIAASAPQALVESSLAALFAQMDRPAAPAAGGVPGMAFWLQAFRGAGQAGWDTARDQLLMRLNERRSRLEAEVAAPVVLLLPGDAQRNAAVLAPDLWHVRVHSAVLEAAAAPGPDADGLQADTRSVAVAATRPVAGDEPREVRYWRAQQRLAPTPQQAAEPVSARLNIWDGVTAVTTSIERGRFAEAQSLIDGLLPLALAQWRNGEGAERARDEHDLAAVYGLAGQLALDQGRDAAALAALQQAVLHMRSVLDAQGASPQNMQMLGGMLNRLGSAFEELDQLDAAEQAYQEALSYHRGLLQKGSEDAGLDAVATTLINIGDVHRRRAELALAEAAYAQALALTRDALQLGETAQRWRRLAVILFQQGRVWAQLGRLDAAAAALHEALAADRQRLADSGPTPEALSDVAMDLQALAALDGQPHAQRLAAANEAWQLRQRQVALYPGVDAFERARDRARQTLDNLQQSDQHPTP